MTVVSGCTLCPSRAAATASISNNDNCGAPNTTTSSLSSGAAWRARNTAISAWPIVTGAGRGSAKTASSAVIPGMWNSATEPKLASAVPKCFSASEPGTVSIQLDDRDLPIGAASLADDAAQRTPFAEIARRRGEAEPPGRAPAGVEVIAVAGVRPLSAAANADGPHSKL